MGLTEDLDNGVIDRFRSLPMARSAVLGGRTLADLARNAFGMTLMILLAFLPVFPFVFASAVFLPTQTMPGWLQAFANNQPITVIANAMRGLMIGPELLLPGQTVAGQVFLALVWITAIIAVFAPLAVRVYRRAVV